MSSAALPEVGRRVRLVGSHPWAGHSGRVIRAETWMGRPAVVVELDDAPNVPPGHTAGLQDRAEWKEERRG